MLAVTLECGEYDAGAAKQVIVCKNVWEMKRVLLKRRRACAREALIGYSDDHLGGLFCDAHIPYLHTYHGNWPEARYINAAFFCKSFYFIPLYKRTVRHARAVANVSAYMKGFTERYNARTVVIRNGVNEKTTTACAACPKAFLMVGSIDGRKYRYAPALAKRLAALAPDVSIHIYGAVVSRTIGAALLRQPNVRLMGRQKAVPYSAYSGLICVSKMENLSIAACEAIRSGIPVFAFAVGGLPEVIIEGKTGWLAEAFDAEALAGLISDYSKREIPMRVDESVLEHFNWEYAASEYQKLFSACLQECGRAEYTEG